MHRFARAFVLLALTSALLTPRAFAAMISIDEKGNGSIDGTSDPGTIGNDPGPGGLMNVLVYRLPFAGVQGDVLMFDSGVGAVDDVLRFNGDSTVIFYSDNINGLVDLADTPSPPTAFYQNSVEITETANPPTVYTPTAGQPGFDASNPVYFFSSAPGTGGSACGQDQSAKGGKPPTIKPIKFPKQALGASSSPSNATLTNTTGAALTISKVSVSADFTQNNGCVGTLAPGAICDISVMFNPQHPGTRTGTLTVATNGPTVRAALSGVGVMPKCASVNPVSQSALEQVTLGCTGLAPAAPVVVTFSEKLLSGKKIASFPVAATENTGTSVSVTVPPVIDPSSAQVVAGSAAVGIQELLPAGTLSSKSTSLSIGQPSTMTALPPDTVVGAFLQQEQSFAAKLGTDVGGTQLGTDALVSSLGMVANQSGSLLMALDGGNGTQLGSVGGVNVTVGQTALTMADDQLLNALQALANGNGSPPGAAGTRAQASGTGCLAAEAAAALSDAAAGNAAAFANDMANLFNDSETSAACMQTQAAITAAGIVNGAGAASLALLTQSANSHLSGAVPGQALSSAGLGTAGQLIGIGVSLAQPNNQGEQAVFNSVKAFNEANNKQLTKVISNTQGLLHNSYNQTGAAAGAFDNAQQPFDGSYSGAFSGTLFATSGTSCAVSGPVAFSVSGSTLTVTEPGSGTGNFQQDKPGTGFTTGGVGGPNVSCSFGGTFSVDLTGAASVSGTWSCVPADPTMAGFTAANGTWSASRM